MTQEALKLALEALEKCRTYHQQDWSSEETTKPEVKQAITAIKEALRENAMREVQRLGQEIEQEPVAYWKEHAQGLQRDYDSLLADFQAQRTWVGLTDKEMYKLWLTVDEEVDRMAFGKAVEAKLKEKNT